MQSVSAVNNPANKMRLKRELLTSTFFGFREVIIYLLLLVPVSNQDAKTAGRISRPLLFGPVDNDVNTSHWPFRTSHVVAKLAHGRRRSQLRMGFTYSQRTVGYSEDGNEQKDGHVTLCNWPPNFGMVLLCLLRYK